MSVLAHIANFGLAVLDAVPRRRVPPLLAVCLGVAAAVWPELLIRVAEIRAEGIAEAVSDALKRTP